MKRISAIAAIMIGAGIIAVLALVWWTTLRPGASLGVGPKTIVRTPVVFNTTAPKNREWRPELTQGQVRVVLLRGGPVASTSHQPTFGVTYGVEVPTEGAFSDLSFSSTDEISLVVRGKPIDFRGEFSSGAMGFNELPRANELRKPAVQDGKAMIFQDLTLTGLRIDARQIDIRLRFSWRGSPLGFDFQSVPVGYRNGEKGRRGTL